MKAKSRFVLCTLLLAFIVLPPTAHSASQKTISVSPGQSTFFLLNASISDHVSLTLTYVSQNQGSVNLTLIDHTGHIIIQTVVSIPTQIFAFDADSSDPFVVRLSALASNPSGIQMLVIIDITRALAPGIPQESLGLMTVEIVLLGALLIVSVKAWHSGV